MLGHVLSPDPLSICVLAVGGVVTGLVDLYCGPRLRSPARVLLVVSGAVLLAASLAAQRFGLVSENVPLALVLLAGLTSSLFLLRSGGAHQVGRLLLRLLCSRQLQAITLLMFCVTLALGWAIQQDVRDTLLLEGLEARTEVHLEPALKQVPGHARTDRGREVSLFTVPVPPPATEEEKVQIERQMVRDKGTLLRLIRISDLDWRANCHGWVFTGGRYWLKPEDVAVILEDNGYEQVSDPTVGDLAITQDDVGRILHSGIVRSGPPGPLMIESKWGYLGRYLHAPEDNPYGGFTYYRSQRSGHILKDLLD